MGVKRSKTRRPRSASPDTIARAVAEADIEEAAVVAKRYGVSVGTIRTWRLRASLEPELRELVHAARLQSIGRWRPAASATMEVLLRELRDRVKEFTPLQLIAALKLLGNLNVEAGALLGDPQQEESGEEKAH